MTPERRPLRQEFLRALYLTGALLVTVLGALEIERRVPGGVADVMLPLAYAAAAGVLFLRGHERWFRPTA